MMNKVGVTLLIMVIMALLLSGCTKTADTDYMNPTIKEDPTTAVNDLLSQNSQQYPKHIEILDVTEGDIGEDGISDIVAVLQYQVPKEQLQEDEGEYLARILCIYSQEENKYKLVYRNDNLVLNSNCGGVYGDPYAGIDIKHGIFTLSSYGGSSDRWGYSYKFKMAQGELVLQEIVNMNININSGMGTETIYNLNEGRVETYTYSEPEESEAHLLLYKGTFTPVIYTITDVTAQVQDELILSPKYPMPLLSCYGNDEEEDGTQVHNKDCNYSPEDILDIVKQKYYPDMKKIIIPCDKKILDNYSMLVGYRVPSYYYQNADGELSYMNVEFHDYYQRWQHIVVYTPYKEEEESEYYWIWDDTGEEETFDN